MAIVDSYMYVSFHTLNVLINIMASHLGAYTQTLQDLGFLWVHLQGFQRGSIETGGICAISLPSKSENPSEWVGGGGEQGGSSTFNNQWRGHNQVRVTRTLSQDTQIQRAQEKKINNKKPCLRQCKILSFSANSHTSSLVTRLLAQPQNEVSFHGIGQR